MQWLHGLNELWALEPWFVVGLVVWVTAIALTVAAAGARVVAK